MTINVSTVALLSRRQGLTAAMFTAYWRDVHGVMAARIPGFDSYTQFHLGPLVLGRMALPAQVGGAPDGEQIHGFAEVHFTSASERQALSDSTIAAYIREDERNVFSSSWLYNLPSERSLIWSRTLEEEVDARVGSEASTTAIVLIKAATGRDGFDASLTERLLASLQAVPAVASVGVFRLVKKDALQWQTTGVNNAIDDSSAFDLALRVRVVLDADVWSAVNNAFESLSGTFFDVVTRVYCYPVTGCFQMVRSGRPTRLGLRGLPANLLIASIGASNQCTAEVVEAIYGVKPG